MVLREISILNYKNISEANLCFSSKINCFVGHNGEGKTNLLDAIYYLSFCKSSFNPNDSQVMRHDSDYMMITGGYESEDGGRDKIFCGLKRGQRKVFKRNDKEYDRLSSHIGFVRLVMVSPNDTELIFGGSDLRRRFMDVVISQYDVNYLHQIIRYRKALQQRNLLLRNGNGVDGDFLEVYEQEMAASGDYIYQSRKEFIEEFKPIFSRIYRELAGENELVDLTYCSHAENGGLLDMLRNSREKDLILGYSHCGLHRDDLVMSLQGFPIKREGSQGQNKTFVIALKLSQFDFLKSKGDRSIPILLLDDIFDKLDVRRVEHIVQMVSGDDFGQIFITDTNKAFLDSILSKTGKDFRFFSVEGGEICHETEE